MLQSYYCFCRSIEAAFPESASLVPAYKTSTGDVVELTSSSRLGAALLDFKLHVHAGAMIVKLQKPAASATAAAAVGKANPNEASRPWNLGKLKIATSFSLSHDSEQAATESYKKLVEKLGSRPGLVVCHLTSMHDGVLASKTLVALSGGEIPIAGGTSCGGVITEEGFHSSDGHGFALWGCIDPDGIFGVGICDKGDDPEAAAAKAATESISRFDASDDEPVGFEQMKSYSKTVRLTQTSFARALRCAPPHARGTGPRVDNW